MRKFWQWLLLAVTGLALMILSPPLAGQAKEITAVTGLDVNSCVIKDARGRVYSHTATLSPKVEYSINYSWRVSNSVRIQNGDTMSFYVPNNVTIVGDRSFPMNGTGSLGVVGTTSIKAGSHVGTVLLNGRLQNSSQRTGFVRIYVTGNQPATPTPPTPAPTKPISMTKTASWAEPDDFTKINWELAVNSNGNTLSHPVIVDQLSSNQTYVQQSTVVKDAAGQTLASATVVNGSKVTIQVRSVVNSDLKISYQTTTNNATRAEIFDNAATYTDDGGHNASANANIDRDDEELTPDEDDDGGTTEPETPEPTEPISMTKSASWVDANDPNKINWDLTVSANGHQLLNPEIVDKMTPNQSYVSDSAKVFDSTGQAIPVTVTTSGTEIVFTIKGNYQNNLRITYQTTPDQASSTETFANAATYHDDHGNNAQATAQVDREGNPSEPDVPGQDEAIQLLKTASWRDPNDFTKINWHLTVIANHNRLVNPLIVDEFTNNQTYIPGSVTAATSDGTAIPVTETVNGNTVSFKLTGTFTDNLQLDYQTKTASDTGTATFDNAALYEDESGNNGSATATIDRDGAVIEPEDPDKTEIGMTKVATWVTPDNFTKINWRIAIAANGNQLVNPKISDLMSPDLTYVEDSATAIDSAGNTLPVSVNVNGTEIVFTIAETVNRDFTLTYQTKTVTADGAATYANAAVYEDDSGNGGSASAEIDRPATEPTPAPEPVPTPEEPSQPEPGQPEKPAVDQPNGSKPGQSGSETPATKPGPSGQVTAPVSKPAATVPATPALKQPLLTSSKTLRPVSSQGRRLPQTNESASTVAILLGLLGLSLGLSLGWLFAWRQRRV